MKRIFQFILAISILCFVSCSKKDDATNTQSYTDQTLFNEIAKNGYIYFKKSTDTIATKAPHGHFVIVRFNSIAAAVLNSSGTVDSLVAFPEGSVVVKEVYNDKGGPLQMYAIMAKSEKDENTKGNWVWAEYKADGTSIISVSTKGQECFSCHNSSPTNDLVKVFAAHP